MTGRVRQDKITEDLHTTAAKDSSLTRDLTRIPITLGRTIKEVEDPISTNHGHSAPNKLRIARTKEATSTTTEVHPKDIQICLSRTIVAILDLKVGCQ